MVVLLFLDVTSSERLPPGCTAVPHGFDPSPGTLFLQLIELHLFSLRIGTFSTERGMGQFISAAAFKLRQSFSTSTYFIRIGSRVFIFDRRQWISAGAFNFGMDIQ